MPLCYIFTNLPPTAIPADFEDTFTNCVAQVLNKPVERITVIVQAGLRMTHSGKQQQGLVCQIHAINVFDAERNPKYYPPINACIAGLTKLEPTKISIELLPLEPHMAKTGV